MQLFDSLWAQESSRGSNLTPNGMSKDKNNPGHGWFQLDPASGYDKATLDRAAKDPTFATDFAAKMLVGFYKQYGTWEKAVEAYNAGSPGLPKGQQYASEVFSRIRNRA